MEDLCVSYLVFSFRTALACVFGFVGLETFTVSKDLALKTKNIWPKQWKKLRILTLISMVEPKVCSASQTCYPFVTCLFMTYLWEFNWWAEQEDTVLLFTNCLTVPWVANARMLFVHGWCWTAYVAVEQLLNVSVLALACFQGVVSVVVGRWEVFCLGSKL